jgi:hypothetical protein
MSGSKPSLRTEKLQSHFQCLSCQQVVDHTLGVKSIDFRDALGAKTFESQLLPIWDNIAVELADPVRNQDAIRTSRHYFSRASLPSSSSIASASIPEPLLPEALSTVELVVTLHIRSELLPTFLYTLVSNAMFQVGFRRMRNPKSPRFWTIFGPSENFVEFTSASGELLNGFA